MPSENIENKVFKGEDFTKEALGKVTYDQCDFIQCNFEKADLSYVQFQDCCFKNCNLDRAKLRETSFDQVVFDGCKMLGIHFSIVNQFQFDVQFIECTLDFSIFEQMRIRKSSFEGCHMHELDFTEADLRESSFKECDLHRTTFVRTKLEDVDFSSAINYTINLEENQAKGAIFSRNQVEGLLNQYQIKIED